MKKNNSKEIIPIVVLSIILAGYAVMYFVNNSLFQKSGIKFIALTFQIAPFLLIVFIVMFLNFWFIKPEAIKKYFGEKSGLTGYVFSILFGIISVGSVYMWYPLLNDLRKSGMSNKLIAVFIYNRAIKLHLLPVMILYFGLKYTLALTVLVILYSLVIGYSVEKIGSKKIG